MIPQSRSFPPTGRSGRVFCLALALLAALFACAACGPLLNPGPPPVRLQLSPALPAPMLATPLQRQLVVATPVAGREIDTDNIALLFNNREVRYLAGARWTSSVPFLVQSGLIEALEASRILRGVSNESAGISADVRLLTDIRSFHLIYQAEGTTPTAVFEATFRLLNLSNGKILDTHTVEVRVPAASRDRSALAGAVETAFAKALDQTVTWVAQTLRAKP